MTIIGMLIVVGITLAGLAAFAAIFVSTIWICEHSFIGR